MCDGQPKRRAGPNSNGSDLESAHGGTNMQKGSGDMISRFSSNPYKLARNQKPLSKNAQVALTIGALICLYIVKDVYFPTYALARTEATLVGKDNCACDLRLSTNCLNAVDCLVTDLNAMDNAMASGVTFRERLKDAAPPKEHEFFSMEGLPYGKTIQKATIEAWHLWRAEKKLPIGQENDSSRFADASLYPECVEQQLEGKNCHLKPNNAAENPGALEVAAMGRLSQEQASRLHTKADFFLQLLARPADQIDATDFLIGYSQFTNVIFNPRDFLRKSYDDSVVTKEGSYHNDALPELRISLHIRRGDACDHKTDGYENRASHVTDEPQQSGRRKCYETQVYMRALNRVKQMVNGRKIVVYLATDHAGQILEEISQADPVAYEEFTWKYLTFSNPNASNENLFDYSPKDMDHSPEASNEVYIESELVDKSTQTKLGEAAILDIWHLSHGQVFIGNIGSRFGKAGWLTSVGRNNMFVPYFSVDGRSPCCDIDEQCSTIAPYVSDIENCFTFTLSNHEVRINDDYWDIGNIRRKKNAKQGVAKIVSNMMDRFRYWWMDDWSF